MQWSNVGLIFYRDVRDQLRDRRTLFMILVLPILLYPAMALAVVHMTGLFARQPRRVAVVGAEYLPERPALVDREKKQFATRWFPGFSEAAQADQAEQLELSFGMPGPEALERREVQVVIIFPADTQQKLAEGKAIEPEVARNTADEKSLDTYGRVLEILTAWQGGIRRERLADRQLSDEFVEPIQARSRDVASPQQRAANLWSKLFPFLLVIMALTGAFYPAVDLCAGEKERGTMETLLITPAARSEIVMGKFCTIAVFSIATAILNLLSMGITGWHMAAVLNQSVGRAGPPHPLLGPPPALTPLWVLLLLPLLAAFFSSLSLALAAFARSSKEGQYYLMPLFLGTMPLTMLIMAPGVELNLFYSMVPVTGIALLFKSLLMMQYDVALRYALPVVVPTVLYSTMALHWAMSQFQREEVLFREAERLDLGLWVRHLLRDKEPTPSSAEAIFCFVVIMMIMWFSSAFFRPDIQDGKNLLPDLLRIHGIIQVAFFATPALLMTVMLTRSPRDTLLLRLPPWKMIPLSLLLAVACHPLIVELGFWIERWLPLDPAIKRLLSQLVQPGEQWAAQLLVIALLPAICEELAFRGFILSGLLRGRSLGRAIVLSSIFFALAHMLSAFQHALTTIWLGLVIGLLAVRSRSLLPGSLFHFTNNALALWFSSLAVAGAESPLRGMLLRQVGGEADAVAYQLPVLLLSAVVALALISALVRPLRARPVSLPETLEEPVPTAVG